MVAIDAIFIMNASNFCYDFMNFSNCGNCSNFNPPPINYIIATSVANQATIATSAAIFATIATCLWVWSWVRVRKGRLIKPFH